MVAETGTLLPCPDSPVDILHPDVGTGQNPPGIFPTCAYMVPFHCIYLSIVVPPMERLSRRAVEMRMHENANVFVCSRVCRRNPAEPRRFLQHICLACLILDAYSPVDSFWMQMAGQPRQLAV